MRSRRLVVRVGLLLIVIAAVVAVSSQRLEWRGRYKLGDGPCESYVFANRSDEPYFARIAWADGSSAPLMLPPRSTTDVELPVSASGKASTEVWRVDAKGPGAVEHVVEWTTLANEELTLTLAADGSESREVAPRPGDGGHAIFTFRSQLEQPVLVFFGDLEPAGGTGARDGEPQPTWIGPAGQDGPRSASLQPGRAVRLRYRVPELQLGASARVDSSEGASHQIAIGEDGSISAGSLSLRTRAGY
jgi:hypothetical protein